MVHRKLKEYLEQFSDLTASSHFGFFDSVPELTEAYLCNIWINGLSELAKDSDSTTEASVNTLKQRYLSDKNSGAMKEYWNKKKLEQEVEKSQREAEVQATIAVNRTTARVMQSAEKNGNGLLEKLDQKQPLSGSPPNATATATVTTTTTTTTSRKELDLTSPSNQPSSPSLLPTLSSSSSKISPLPASMSSSTSKTKNRKTGSAISVKETIKRPRFHDMDKRGFWKLSSGRMVETVLFESSLTGQASFKMRSYTIDFNCVLTKSLFTELEWADLNQFNKFSLPTLPPSTADYIKSVRIALMTGKHITTIPVPEVDRFSCEQVLKSLLSWTHLYTTKPSPFGNGKLSERYWMRQGWPLINELLSDIDDITMVDGEKRGAESTKRKGKDRRLDIEGSAPRKPGGKKFDCIARDTTNDRDWFLVESMKDWDETSTKFLHENGVLLFKELHLIAAHRVRETNSAIYKDKARFFSIYSGGRGFKAMELRQCPQSQYVMLSHAYPTFILPSNEEGWRCQLQGLTHLLQIRMCMKETIGQYNQAKLEDESGKNEDDGSWMYNVSHKAVYDSMLASDPLGPDDLDLFGNLPSEFDYELENNEHSQSDFDDLDHETSTLA
ncbi:hypothetical protein BGZ46_010473 [Entomortierella lignicola]|nr:hypothetical protein BGZ46_010473 [Entomortierella lignicola]